MKKIAIIKFKRSSLLLWRGVRGEVHKEIFYVTNCSAAIKHGCVTPLYCNNSMQHENHKYANAQIMSQSLVSLCLCGSGSSTMLKHESVETWFEFETKDAIKNLSTSVPPQAEGTMPQSTEVGNRKNKTCHTNL